MLTDLFFLGKTARNGAHDEFSMHCYVFATFVGYASGMAQHSSIPIPTPDINHSFILRMTCDGSTGNWRILLKPLNDADSRLFSDLESTFLHLEMWMIKQIQQMNRELHSEVHSENQ